MTARYEPLRDRLVDCVPGDVAISTISFAEVAYGTYVGKSPPTAILEAFIAAIPLAPFDEAAAHAYALLPFKRARFDRLLAAQALSLGATIITNNEADRSEERREGKECVSKCRSRGSPYH